jgi:hypothetical protein
MRQTLAFANKRMRVAYTKAGKDVWIVYFRVHTGQDTRDSPEYTERGYLYSSAQGPGRLTNENIDFKTFVEELNINGVKDYQWRARMRMCCGRGSLGRRGGGVKVMKTERRWSSMVLKITETRWLSMAVIEAEMMVTEMEKRGTPQGNPSLITFPSRNSTRHASVRRVRRRCARRRF